MCNRAEGQRSDENYASKQHSEYSTADECGRSERSIESCSSDSSSRSERIIHLECVTKGDAVDDSADILAACDGAISPEGLRMSTFVLKSGVVTKTSFDFEGLRFRKSSP